VADPVRPHSSARNCPQSGVYLEDMRHARNRGTSNLALMDPCGPYQLTTMGSLVRAMSVALTGRGHGLHAFQRGSDLRTRFRAGRRHFTTSAVVAFEGRTVCDRVFARVGMADAAMANLIPHDPVAGRRSPMQCSSGGIDHHTGNNEKAPRVKNMQLVSTKRSPSTSGQGVICEPSSRCRLRPLLQNAAPTRRAIRRSPVALRGFVSVPGTLPHSGARVSLTGCLEL
jgi:hypothetical protein